MIRDDELRRWAVFATSTYAVANTARTDLLLRANFGTFGQRSDIEAEVTRALAAVQPLDQIWTMGPMLEPR